MDPPDPSSAGCVSRASAFLSGRVELSDDQLDRLLSCMSFQLEVARRPVVPKLTRSERRSWLLHRRLSTLLSSQSFEDWLPTVERHLDRVREGVTSEPRERNLHRVLAGLDRDSIEMRGLPPCPGLLTNDARREVLQPAS